MLGHGTTTTMHNFAGTTYEEVRCGQSHPYLRVKGPLSERPPTSVRVQANKQKAKCEERETT